MGRYPSGQRGLTVNQLSDDFGGSNPSLPTEKLPLATSLNVLSHSKRENEEIDPINSFEQSDFRLYASIAQAVERILGKNEVMGSSPIGGSRN